MTGWKDSRRTLLVRLISVVVMGLLALLVFVRSARLLQPLTSLDGVGERSRPWAFRDAGLMARLRQVEPSLRFGEIVWITVPDSSPRYDPGWFRVMAGYAWPYQNVLGVSSEIEGRRLRITTVEFKPSGAVHVRRSGEGRD